MPSTKPTLTNCYTPSSLSSTKISIHPTKKRPNGTGTPNQTRSNSSIRHLCLDRSVLSSSTGSSLVELGHTKVLCSVHGPRPVTSSSSFGGGDFHSSGVLNCELRYAPTFGIKPETKVLLAATNLDGYCGGTGGGAVMTSSTSAQEVELSSRLHDAISPSIPLNLLLKSVVDVYVMILQDDGSAFAASVIAASLALSDAGIEVYDMVVSCSVAVIPRAICGNNNYYEEEENDPKSNYELLVDPVEHEILAAEGVVTLAYMSSWKEVTFWDQTGRLPPQVSERAAELCKDGCVMMSKFVRKCLIGESSATM